MMMRFPAMPYGGHRTQYGVSGQVVKVEVVRPLLNLFRKTKRYHIEWPTKHGPTGFKNSSGKELLFPSKLTITDIGEGFEDLQIGDAVEVSVGYADQDQQYYHGVKPFTYSVNGKAIGGPLL